MAITEAPLAGSFDETHGTNFATASVSPTADRLQVLFVAASLASGVGAIAAPTITSTGLTWSSSLAHVTFFDSAGNTARLDVFVATGASPSAGAVSIAYAATMANCLWSLMEFDGCDLSGGAAATVVQAPTNVVDAADGTSLSITLAAAGNAANRPVAGFVTNGTNAITPRASWSEIHESVAGTAPVRRIESQWRSDAFETTASASWSLNQRRMGIALELKAIVAGGFNAAWARNANSIIGAGAGP